jgi:hypothetical protein
MTLQTTAFRTVLIILAAAAILQVHSALTSEPAIATAATTIRAGDEAGFTPLASVKVDPLSWISESSPWSWKWMWVAPSGERFFGAEVGFD